MFDQEDGHALFTQLLNDVKNLLNDDRRQPQRGLVEQQQLRLAHQCTAYRQHLLLTAGHGARALRTAFQQARKQAKHPFDALLILVTVGKETAHRQVLLHRHAREYPPAFRHDRHRFAHDARRLPLGNVLIEKGDAAFAGAGFTAQRAEQRGFTGAVSADQSDNLALLYVQANLMQRLDFAVMGGYLIK
ncbi:hypothetical protein D3C78_1333360 [compost metagenome]